MANGGRFDLNQFVNPGADSLFAKVDFFGVIGAFGRSIFLAVVTGIVAIPLALAGAFEEVIDAAMFLVRSPFDALAAWLTGMQNVALAAAASELPAFELFALPVSAVAALGPVLVVAFVVALFWGFD